MKVKCSICGKVAQQSDKKGQKRHMRLAHNIMSLEGYFIEADPDAVVDLMSTTKKAYRKEQNKKFKPAGVKLSNKKIGKAKHKSIYWGAVLKSGFETKR